MSTKRIKCENSEEFKKIVVEDFLPTLQACSQGARIGYDFHHPDICSIQILTPQGQLIYSVWRDVNTNYVEWYQGRIGKYQDKNIN